MDSLYEIIENPRVRTCIGGEPDPAGRCVVYWMRRAQRAVDNPALEAAITTANLVGKMVLPARPIAPARRASENQSVSENDGDHLPIRIGVSACLLGEQVRFDGGHKRDGFLVDTFGRFVQFVPVCPEMEIGLGVPRETLRLERDHGRVRLIANNSRLDHTDRMENYARRRAAAFSRENLSGYVLKKNSPSCGMERVRVYDQSGTPSRDGRGLFADALLRRWPNLPIEEEGRLNDPRLRENFIERVFAYHRLRGFFSRRWTHGGLIGFHTAHKLQLLSHSPRAYAELGRVVAGARESPRLQFSDRYEREFMAALATPATPARHVNVMHHMIGYFRRNLDAGVRREMLTLIDDYRAGLVPLIVPITLIRHYVRLFNVDYLRGQTYLEPHPKELMLRNHV